MTDIEPYRFEPEKNILQDEDDLDCFEERGIIDHTNRCLCELCVRLAQVTSEHLTFVLPVFESGFRCSHNGALQ